jgi:Domain of unknown function (DUF2019)
MTTNTLKAMTVSELVERFAAIAVDQDKAIFEEDNTRFNKLYGLMEAVRRELKARPGDQRKALLPLFEHPNLQVRLKAAITTLALAPGPSQQLLQAIANSKRFPQAADAGLILDGLSDGSFVAS